MKWFFIVWTLYNPSVPIKMVHVEAHSQIVCEQRRTQILHQLEMSAEEDENFQYGVGECSVRETR